MVQHTSLGNVLNEINEFQVVHALITQSLKGEQNEKETCGASDGCLETGSSQHHLVSALCQTFNSFNASSNKRIFPKFVKEFISHVRKSHDRSVPMSSSSIQPSVHSDKRLPPVRKQSCVVRYASILKANNEESTERTAPKSIKSSSSVHDKVLQFEKQADLVRSPGSQDTCSSCRAPEQSCRETSSDRAVPCLEECRPNSGLTEEPPLLPDPPNPPTPHKTPVPPKESRSLKRVPSERFQKMRRKVQRLMSRRSDDEPRPVAVTDPVSEIEFLRSIRIPEPGHRAPSMILIMPDHVLCHIFSHLDTRTLASLKCVCSAFNFVVNNFDVRSTDSRWTKDPRYLSDPCIQCRHIFVRGDMTMCRFHPKRYYSDLPYGRSYWMCCLQYSKSAPGCRTGLHDNHWIAMT